jgi:hypothetical protein
LPVAITLTRANTQVSYKTSVLLLIFIIMLLLLSFAFIILDS